MTQSPLSAVEWAMVSMLSGSKHLSSMWPLFFCFISATTGYVDPIAVSRRAGVALALLSRAAFSASRKSCHERVQPAPIKTRSASAALTLRRCWRFRSRCATKARTGRAGGVEVGERRVGEGAGGGKRRAKRLPFCGQPSMIVQEERRKRRSEPVGSCEKDDAPDMRYSFRRWT